MKKHDLVSIGQDFLECDNENDAMLAISDLLSILEHEREQRKKDKLQKYIDTKHQYITLKERGKHES